MALWVAFLAILPLAHCQLTMNSAPRMVYPDITPSFSLNCALKENEEAKIVSMHISRRTAGLGNDKTGLPQRLVSLSSRAPIAPQVETPRKGLTTLGQITNIESEAGSYLQLVWPNPTVDDLGTYTCEAVIIGKRGRLVTLLAQAQVTSGQPVLDRVLLTLSQLETTMDVFNVTLQDIQTQVDNITAIQQDMLLKDATGEVKPLITTPMPPEVTTFVDVQTTDGSPPVVPDASLERLAVALDKLTSKLNQFNSTLMSLEQKIDRLGTGGTAAPNTTGTEAPDHVQNFFSYNSSIYFLISSPMEFNSKGAQTICQGQSINLAEVQDGSELNAIADNSALYVSQDQLVLISGQKAAGSTVWQHQATGSPVTYFGGGAAPQGSATEDTCLALQKTIAETVVVGVPCGQLQTSALVLCEDELFVSSGEAENLVVS